MKIKLEINSINRVKKFQMNSKIFGKFLQLQYIISKQNKK